MVVNHTRPGTLLAMGKRRRHGGPDRLVAPATGYTSDGLGQTLELRGAMTARTREQYRRETGPGGVRAAMTQDDTRERAIEFLFERLVCGWTISGVATTKPKELLLRYRAATRDERAWITDVLREHCREWFPDVVVP